jgi:hypothetical protein
VDLVGDAAALGVDRFRFAPALFVRGDVFHRDDHVAAIRRVGRGDHARRKARAVPVPAGGLGRHGLALLDPLDGGQDDRQGLLRHQLGGWHPHQLGGRVAVDQFCLPVDLLDGRRAHGQVDDKDAEGRVLEQVAVALFAGLACVIGLVGRHAEFVPFARPAKRAGPLIAAAQPRRGDALELGDALAGKPRPGRLPPRPP